MTSNKRQTETESTIDVITDSKHIQIADKSASFYWFVSTILISKSSLGYILPKEDEPVVTYLRLYLCTCTLERQLPNQLSVRFFLADNEFERHRHYLRHVFSFRKHKWLGQR